MEFLQSLQLRQKWIRPKKSLQKGDVVIVSDELLSRNQWKLGRVSEVYASNDGLVRKVRLAMADPTLDNQGRRRRPVSYFDRPIHKLVLLLAREDMKTKDSPTKEPVIRTISSFQTFNSYIT
jgi:hypothetical protein